MEHKTLVIIGSGPAGFTAAIYAARADLKPLMYEGFFSGTPGGQLMTTTEVENFPGFEHGITGPKLMENMRKQALRFGTDILTEDVESVDFSSRPFKVFGKKTAVTADTVIIATGAQAKRLDIEGTRDGELWQKGVTACAVCDGAMPIFREKDLYVVGGGDTAVEEALFLTKYGRKVYILHRRDELRASKIMARHAIEHPKIEILWNTVLAKVSGDHCVEKISLKRTDIDKQWDVPGAGVFFAIGHSPNVGFLKGSVETDSSGYIIVKSGSTATNIDGVFAAGDVQDHIYRQAVSAAGSGCMAALDVERWLTSRNIP